MIQGPCKDCTRRKVGCHNVKTCKDWEVYVEAVNAERERRQEEKTSFMDWDAHLKRRTKGKQLWYDTGRSPSE